MVALALRRGQRFIASWNGREVCSEFAWEVSEWQHRSIVGALLSSAKDGLRVCLRPEHRTTLHFVRGLSTREISRRTGLHRDTISRAIHSDEAAGVSAGAGGVEA